MGFTEILNRPSPRLRPSVINNGKMSKNKTSSVQKLGQCPSNEVFGRSNRNLCIVECRVDGDCMDTKICCFNGCGWLCMTPGNYYSN